MNPRIASLIPSGTDLSAALGFADCLVGVSHECDHPDAIDLPVLTSSSIPPPTVDGPSIEPAEIDRLVSASVQAGDSLYITDRPLLHSLKPTVVVSQDVCDVCAVNAESAACDIPVGADLVLLTAISLDGLKRDILTLACALGTPERGTALVHEVEAGLARSAESARSPDGTGPTVIALEWSDPPFLGGHWVPELIEHVGATHLLSGPGEASRRSSWDEIAAADPDVIIFCPCGYNLHQSTIEANALLARTDVASLRAVREGRFYAVDANRLLSRCTTAVVEAAEVIASLTRVGAAELDRAIPFGASRISTAEARLGCASNA